jgi:hypothetical protein
MLQKSTCTSAVFFREINIISKSAVRAHKIIGPVLFQATINSKALCSAYSNMTHSIYFIQDSAMNHMANFSMTAPKGVI